MRKIFFSDLSCTHGRTCVYGRHAPASDMNGAMNRVPNYPQPFDGLTGLLNRFFIICDKSSTVQIRFYLAR